MRIDKKHSSSNSAVTSVTATIASPVDLNDLYQYDIGSDLWSNLSAGGGQLPTPRNGLGLATLMDQLYVFGGFDDQGVLARRQTEL